MKSFQTLNDDTLVKGATAWLQEYHKKTVNRLAWVLFSETGNQPSSRCSSDLEAVGQTGSIDTIQWQAGKGPYFGRIGHYVCLYNDSTQLLVFFSPGYELALNEGLMAFRKAN